MSICFRPKDKSGTFWCENVEELSDLLEMLGDERDARDSDIYQKGYDDGFKDGEAVAMDILASREANEIEPKTTTPAVDPKIIIPPKTSLLLPGWPDAFAA